MPLNIDLKSLWNTLEGDSDLWPMACPKQGQAKMLTEVHVHEIHAFQPCTPQEGACESIGGSFFLEAAEKRCHNHRCSIVAGFEKPL